MHSDHPILGKFNPAAVKDLARSIIDAQPQPEELRACYETIDRLRADLLECREYLETEVDYGVPAPNRAMELVGMIDEALHGPGGF